MSINATLIAQIAAFVLLIWFVNKVLWGPVSKMMEDRQKRISDGLAAAEKGKHELEQAEQRAKEVLSDAKSQAGEVIAQAEKRANEIVEEAKTNAQEESDRMIASARAQIDQEVNRAREDLRKQVSELAVIGAGRILGKEIDAKAHDKLLQDLVEQI